MPAEYLLRRQKRVFGIGIDGCGRRGGKPLIKEFVGQDGTEVRERTLPRLVDRS
jgi:hypothetical protein